MGKSVALVDDWAGNDNLNNLLAGLYSAGASGVSSTVESMASANDPARTLTLTARSFTANGGGDLSKDQLEAGARALMAINPLQGVVNGVEGTVSDVSNGNEAALFNKLGVLVGTLAVFVVSRTAGTKLKPLNIRPDLATGNTPSPALRGSPYSPEAVADRVRPPYRANPAHDPRSGRFNPQKSIEPPDAAAVYEKSVGTEPSVWYGEGERGWYRFFGDNAGAVHFSGIMPEADVPIQLRR